MKKFIKCFSLIFSMEDLNPEKREEKTEKINKQTESPVTSKIRKNPWILATLVLGILSIVLVFGSLGNPTGKVISSDEATDKLIEFYDAQGITGLELESVNEVDEFYEINLVYEGQTIPFYVTKSGYLTGNAIIHLDNSSEMFEDTDTETNTPTETQEIPKQDVPKVELFVMTHCPYGTQSEKGILPAFEALGDSVDANIRFVHYFMHDPEETETPIQVCIREEQADKYHDYLECFLEDGNSSRCLDEVEIDEDALDECVENNAEGYYASDSELSESYGVQGSPTLVINGQMVQSSRDPASYLDTICQSFTDGNVPESCGNELSSSSPSPGFGWSGTGSDTSAQC